VEAVFMLIPMAVVLLAVIVAVFWWAARSGQFDDLEGPAWRILMDDDRAPPAQDRKPAADEDETPSGDRND
jgi:cbb3-type cytochrome oxidase maturation protein